MNIELQPVSLEYIHEPASLIIGVNLSILSRNHFSTSLFEPAEKKHTGFVYFKTLLPSPSPDTLIHSLRTVFGDSRCSALSQLLIYRDNCWLVSGQLLSFFKKKYRSGNNRLTLLEIAMAQALGANDLETTFMVGENGIFRAQSPGFLAELSDPDQASKKGAASRWHSVHFETGDLLAEDEIAFLAAIAVAASQIDKK